MSTITNDIPEQAVGGEGVDRASAGQDLPDSPHDAARMEPEEVTIDLPDVKDIPGQEHVKVLRMGELADTTISSDDEEGVGLFEEEDDQPISMGTDADVTKDDVRQLETTDKDTPTEDEIGLRKAGLDDVDDEGEPLNEAGLSEQLSGDDLDVPGEEDDDADEETGGEDEENNAYSMGDTE